MTRIESGSFLTLHYRRSGSQGEELVNTFNDKPATLTWVRASSHLPSSRG